MNIIIIHDNAKITGGAQKVAITEAAALSDSGYHVTYFSAVGPVDPMLSSRPIDVICLGQRELKDDLNGKTEKLKGMIRGLYNKQSFVELDKLLRKYNPADTIVHIHGWSLALSATVFKAVAKNKFKVALTCHDYEVNCPVRTYFNYQKNAMCFLKGMSAKCICTNCDKRSYIQKLYRVIREYVFYHYAQKCDLTLIYLSEFNRELINKDLRLKTRGYIVPNLIDIPPVHQVDAKNNRDYLFIGRLNPEKGGRLFCEAVTKAKVKGVVIGAGGDFEQLKKEYPNVDFKGWKTTDEMTSIILSGRCYVMSSICYEGAPLTIPEIQGGYSLPCIVPAPSGAVSYVNNGENGLIYRSGSLAELVQCIKKMEDNDTVERLSSNCRKMFDPNVYTKETHIRNLVNVYKKILG